MFVTSKMVSAQQSKMQVYAPGNLLPVLKASELLQDKKLQFIISDIRELCDLTDEQFAAVYTPAIENFAELVQLIPSQSNSVLCGLLNEGFARAYIAVQTHLVEHEFKKDALLIYAIFTAALFADLAKLFINQRIFLTNEEGEFVAHWLPFDGSMVGKAEYYKMYPAAPIYQRLETSLVPMLAKQILPEQGFRWICSDLKILAEWLDALRGDDGSGGRISLATIYGKREDFFNLLNAIGQVSVQVIQPPATQDAEAFYSWLKNGIANEGIKVNTADAGVHVVDAGVFIDMERTFRDFYDVYHAPVSMNNLYVQFCKMFGIARVDGIAGFNDRYVANYPGKAANVSAMASKQQAVRDGVVMPDPSLLFVHGHIPPANPMLRSMQMRNQTASTLPGIEKPARVGNVSPAATPSPKSRG